MSPAVSSAVQPRGGSGVGSGVASVLLMPAIVRPPGIPCYCLGMAETSPAITGNSDVDAVSLREWIAKHSDHLDQGIHELQQMVTGLAGTVEVMRAQLAEVHAELEAAKPMIEKWQHSKIRRLANGQMPWTD